MTHLSVWGGPVVLVASLAYGVIVYLGRLGDAIPFRTVAEEAQAAGLNILLFTLFAAHHSLMARAGAKAWLTRLVPARLERTTYVWIASGLFILVCWSWQPVGGELYRLEGARAGLAVGVQLLGVLIIVAAVRLLSWGEITGVLQATGSGGRATASAEPILSQGVYKLVRHPLYLGWILMTFGSPHLTGGRLLFAAVSSLYLVLAIPWEERALGVAHGAAYEQYRTRVRWRILPGIY